MSEYLDLAARYIAGPALGFAAVFLFFGIRWATGLPADARKREALTILGLIAAAVVGAWQLGQTNTGALLGVAGQAAMTALLARLKMLDAPTREAPPPPRTVDDDEIDIEVKLP